MAGAQASGKLPKDGAVMAALLHEAGVSQYDARVVDQLLEFTHKYVTGVLDDARVYCNHAKKKNIDLDDIRMAIEMQLEQNYTTPPSRELLAEIVQTRNSLPLPVIKPQCGIRMPPDRYCLTAINYRMKFTKPPLTTGRTGAAGRGSTGGAPGGGGGGTKVAVVPHKTAQHHLHQQQQQQQQQLSSGASAAGLSSDSSSVQITMPKFKVQSDSANNSGYSTPTSVRVRAASPAVTTPLTGPAPLKRKLDND